MSDPTGSFAPVEQIGVLAPINWRHQYDPFIDEQWGDVTKTINAQESLTNQHFAKDADLNNIIKRYGISDGAVPPVALDPAFFGDFTDAPDFRQALDNTREALEHFNALPADLRTRFRNDPVELWTFVTNPANAEEAVKLGLLARDPGTGAPVPPDTKDTANGVS